MKKGSILGVDLNEKSCQISYYDENKEEPETMEAAVDNYQIPLILFIGKILIKFHEFLRQKSILIFMQQIITCFFNPVRFILCL